MTTSQGRRGVEPATDEDFAVRASSPLEDLGGLQRELRDLVHDQLKLIALELRLAAHSLTFMITAAIFMGGLVLLAWIGLMSSAALTLIDWGIVPSKALLAVTALTVILALTLLIFVRHRSNDLGFPATLRTFAPSATGGRVGK